MKTFPNPFYVGVYFDSCAFDGGSEYEQLASVEARDLLEANGGQIIVLHSVAKEIEFPNTPQRVKDLAATYVHTLEVSLTPGERIILSEIESIVTGNGNLENRYADCRHIFEAQKHGRYFVTTDKQILKRDREIFERVRTLWIIPPSKFREVVAQYT